MQRILYRKIPGTETEIIIYKPDWFYFFILNPNIIETQPLAGVSPGALKEETFTISFNCWLDWSLKSHVFAKFASLFE